jgi:hypothetical protein
VGVAELDQPRAIWTAALRLMPAYSLQNCPHVMPGFLYFSV